MRGAMRTHARGSLGFMAMLVLDPVPAELEALVEKRRRLDQDRRDEVWEGVLHMIPPPSYEHERLVVKLVRVLDPVCEAAGLELTGTVGIGSSEHDYRVPDLAVHRPGAEPQWNPTAAMVVEVVSPGDKSWEKLPYYAAHHVDEVLIVDPQKREVHWLALGDSGEYEPTQRSALVELGSGELAQQIDWP